MAALFSAMAVVAMPLVGDAGAYEGTKSIAGKFSGLTEDGGTVSFRITRSGKVVDFTLGPTTLYCVTDPSTDLNHFPELKAEYTKTITITHGSIQMQGRSKKNRQGKKYEFSDPYPGPTVASQGGFYEGKADYLQRGSRVVGTGMRGQVIYGSQTGDASLVGTERCSTKYVDWAAKRPRDPGKMYLRGGIIVQ